jgi:hypothetical protein
MSSKSEIFESVHIGTLAIDENNADSTSAEINSEARGIFLIPSENVSTRGDITGYVLKAGNADGKMIWSASGGVDISLGGISNVDTENSVTGSTVTYNSELGVWAHNTSLLLKDGAGEGSNTITLSAPALTADYTLTFPTNDGDNLQVLSTDGSGGLSWVTQSGGGGGGGTPGGGHTQIQFNEAGEFGGSASLTWDGATLNATGSIKTENSFILEDPTAGTNTVTLKAPDSLGISYVLTLPEDDGLVNQSLLTDGGGGLSWTNPLAVGASGEIQFNTGGVLGASSSLSWEATYLKITGGVESDSLILLETTVDTPTETVTIRAPENIPSSFVLTLPDSAGISNEVLTTDGTGGLSWSAPVASAAGSDNTIQFNSGASTLAGHLNLTWDGLILNVAGALTVSDNITCGSVTAATSFIMTDPGAGTNTITLSSPTPLAETYTVELPPAQGTDGQMLTNDGTGALRWAKSFNNYGVTFITENDSDYDITSDDYLVITTPHVDDVGGGVIRINLPLVASGKGIYNIMDKGYGGNIEIYPSGLDKLLDADNSLTTAGPSVIQFTYGSWRFVNDGVDSWIKCKY